MEKTAISFVSFSLHMVPNIAFYVVEKCEINSKLTFLVLENQIAIIMFRMINMMLKWIKYKKT